MWLYDPKKVERWKEEKMIRLKLNLFCGTCQRAGTVEISAEEMLEYFLNSGEPVRFGCPKCKGLAMIFEVYPEVAKPTPRRDENGPYL